jgi:monothiol glutaredoxin
VSKQTLATSEDDARRLIENDIKSHDVFVYMKGTPAQPRCGFSANVCRILNSYPDVKYGSRDVLEDEQIRQAIKQFSDWPTLPQVFVKGEFVGGSDIIGTWQ